MKKIIEQYNDLPKIIKIGNKNIGEGCPTFFIAEIGNNHNGDYYLARKCIEEAAKAGADAVKFQKRFINEVFTKELQNQPQLKDQIYGKTYGEYRQNLELNEEDFIKLKKLAEELNLIFFATPFDKSSADFLEQIGVDVYKIASFDVTNIPLLEHIAKKNKPIFMSVGMSSEEEVDLAVSSILKHNKKLIIKHCISIYPTPDDKLNLSMIATLKEKYSPLPIGYSGHEKDILPSLAAIAMGAKCIERHFTLDKKLPGPDHATVSLDAEEFKNLVDGARRLENFFGQGNKIILEDEKKARDKHSKSIVAKTFIPAGTKITYTHITYKSPGYGLKPYLTEKIIGLESKEDILEDTVITAEQLNW